MFYSACLLVFSDGEIETDFFLKLNELDNPHEVDAQSKSRMSMHNMQIYIKKSAHQLVAQNVNKQTDERRKKANILSENRVKKRRTVGMFGCTQSDSNMSGLKLCMCASRQRIYHGMILF